MYTAGTELYGNLPLFPTLYNYPNPITEERIEGMVERLTNAADRQFMKGGTTQDQYDRWTTALNKWAEERYSEITRR